MTWSFYDSLGQLKTDGGGTTINELNDVGDVDTTGVVDGSLLRYEAAGPVWNATTASNLLLTDAGQLQAPTLPSTANDLTNQVWVERMDLFYA